MNNHDDYRIQGIGKDEIDEAYDFLKAWFFTEEPITCEWSETPKKEDITCLKSLCHGLSLKAVNSSGKMIGICINCDPAKEVDSTSVPSNLKQLYDFFELVMSQCPSMEGCISVQVVAVSKEGRGIGLCSRLMRTSLRLAEDRGFRGAYVLCTSKYSALAAERLGWTCLLSQPYSSYLNEQQTPLYSPQPPHTNVSVYQMTVFDEENNIY